MATAGDVVNGSNAKRAVCLITGVSATNNAPSGATAGIEAYPDPVKSVYGTKDEGCFYAGQAPREATVATKVTGSPSAVLTLWGYLVASAAWHPIKVLNGGAAITANASEVVQVPGHFDRLYVQVGAVTGSGSYETWSISSRSVAY